MRFEKEFRERCVARGMDEKAVARAWGWVLSFEEEARIEGFSAEGPPLGFVEAYLASLLEADMADEERIRALARFFFLAGSDNLARRLLARLQSEGGPSHALERT